MLKIISLFLLIVCLSESQIISRNGKLQEIYDKYQTQIEIYNDLLEKTQDKVEQELNMCIHSHQDTNCSQLKIWQHERTKHSKNITNLQNKIASHQKTIQNIIKLNQEETHKKGLTIKRLLPELIKAKNDIEYIEGIQFLIQDTYLNIEEPQESILNIFDAHFGNPVQTQLAQMLAKRYDHDPGARPQQADYLPEKPEEEPPVAKKDYFQGPPLIDEVIFDGHNEHYPQATVRDLFNSLGGVSEEVPVADLIPDGVDVPEHDRKSTKIDNIVKGYKEAKAAEAPQENLQVIELQPEFKAKIKEQGQILYDRLEVLKKSLMQEQDRIAQAIADLEKAALNLHFRHARQIVQIYIESKKIQREIFEKDDTVLKLDSLIHDCTNLEHKVKKCEKNKLLTLAYIRDLEQQKDLNIGILKELQKLNQFPDKNIDPPVIPPGEIPEPTGLALEIQKEIEQSQKEMHQIAEAEAEVEKENQAAAAPAPEEPAQPAAPSVEQAPVESVEQAPVESVEQVPVESVEQAPVEQAPVEQAPVEQAPVEQAPVEQAPVEQAPVEQAPVEQAPVEQAPVEQAPVEQAPVEQAPVEQAPVEQAPVEQAPVEQAPVEQAPVEQAPVEQAPVEQAPVEQAPVEQAPVEQAPVEQAPVEQAPVEQAPVEQAPVEQAPVEQAPVEQAPVEQAPVEQAPVEQAPVEEAPAPQLLANLKKSKKKKN